MINIKEIRDQIVTEAVKIVAQKYNAPESEVKVTFGVDGNLKATITPDLSFLSCNVKVEENQ